MNLRKRFFIKRILFFFAMVLIPIVFIFLMVTTLVFSTMKNTINEKAHAQLMVSKNNMETVLNVTDHIALLFRENPELTVSTWSLLHQDKIDFGAMVTYKTISHMVRYPTVINRHIRSVYLYLNNNNQRFLTSSARLEKLTSYFDTSWYDSYHENRHEKKVWFELRNIPNEHGGGFSKAVSIYQPLANGVIVTDTDQQMFNSLMSDYKNHPDEILLIANRDGQVLFSNVAVEENLPIASQDELKNLLVHEELQIKNKGYIINNEYSERFGLYFWSFIPKSNLYAPLQGMLAFTIIVLLSTLAVTWICVYVSTKRSFGQIEQIVEVFYAAERGHPLPPEMVKVANEYSLILNNVIQTFVNQSFLNLQLSERAYKQETAELVALQHQINPHFLFNILQTIDFEIIKLHGEETSANTILQQLAMLLNYSLESTRELATIEEEIKHSKIYVQIQKFRYEDKLAVFWDYEEDVLKQKISRLILQPFIENSLYHGIKPKEETGLIRIKIRRKNERIYFIITDTGIGMSPERLEQVTCALRTVDENALDKSIGLYNTNRRLILTFDENSGLHVRSKTGLGTSIQFSIPAL